MAPYFLLIFIPVIFLFISVNKRKGETTTLSFGLDESQNEGNLALWVFFLLFLLLLVFRKETVGRDLASYRHYFEEFPRYHFSELIKGGEPLFKILNWVIGNITSDYQWYLAIVASIAVIPIAVVYNRDRSYGYLKLIIFVNMSTFIMIFSGVRQAMAMGIGVLAYLCVKSKKIVPFLLLATLALLMHHSGFMVFFMYPAYYLKLNKKSMFIMAPSLVVAFAFNRPIFGLLMKIASSFSDKYEMDINKTGAFTSLVLFAMFFAFSYFISDEENMDAESLGLRNFLLVTVILQCFAPLNNLAMRMNYYYILFIPLAVADAIKNAKEEYKDIAKLAEAVLCIFFTVYFLYEIYNSYKTGKSTLDTVPYEFFWQ